MKQCLAGRIRRGGKERKEKGETLKRDKDSESETGIKRKSGEGRHVRVEVARGGASGACIREVREWKELGPDRRLNFGAALSNSCRQQRKVF